MPRNNQDTPDEPQRRRRPEGENNPQRPTQDRPQNPRFDMPHQGPAHLPAARPNDQRAPVGDTPNRNRAPDLSRASGAETRAAMQGAHIPGHMRDMLNNLRRIDQPGDMTDAEARRYAQQDDAGAEPRPQDQQNLPALVRSDVANINNAVAAAGQVHPKWHSVARLPGFQNKQIRGMGGDLFSAFTTTPHQNILTISSQMGQSREVQAVAQWLLDNGDNRGEINIDYSGYGMPDYHPEVTEFSTENTRFHLVRDEGGMHIYAYPESTAVEHSNDKQSISYDGGSADEIERDEYGTPIKRINEGTHMKFTTISEQIRHTANMLENLEEAALLDKAMTEALDDMMIDESTLAQLLGPSAGAKQLVRALHSRHKLASGGLKNRPGHQNIDPNYEEIPAGTKNIAVTIKSNKDNFCIIVGTNGVAGVKPESKAWDQSRSKERDPTLPYVVVWSTGNGAESEIAKYRMGRMDATGGSSGQEGGAPNLFQVLRDRIGTIVHAYRATGAVEHGKMGARQELKRSSVATVDQVGEKIKPVLAKLLQSTVGQLGPRINRMAQGGDYDGATKLATAGKKLQAMLTALDSPNPEWTGWRTPLGTYGEIIRGGINELTQGMDDAGKAQFMNNAAAGQAKELGELLNFIRSRLFRVS